MNKVIKIFVGFLIGICALFLLDYLVFQINAATLKKQCNKLNIDCLVEYSIHPENAINAAFTPSNAYRPTSGLQYRKQPIYIFGCSFAYGAYLDDKDIFSTKLSELTGYTVYNRGILGASLPHFYYQIEHNQINFSKTKPKYVIYIMIYDQIRRMNSDFFRPTDYWYNLTYKEKNGNFYLNDHKKRFLPTLYIERLANCIWGKFVANSPLFYDYNFNIVNLYFLKTKKIIYSQSPDTKFVIFLYDNPRSDFWFFNTPKLKELEKEGFIVIKMSELLNGSRILANESRLDHHPTAKDWQVITPLFAKKLGLL